MPIRKEFLPGTIVRCNRCDIQNPLEKRAWGIYEGNGVYRLEHCKTLPCGHFDAHWVIEGDKYGNNNPPHGRRRER